MHSDLNLHLRNSYTSLNVIAEKYSLLILGALLALTTYQKWTLIQHTDGGGDLLGADIPKSMMLITGQNPYSSNPWASPYPPLLLAIVGSIIRITTGTLALSPSTIGLISRNVRTTGLVADATVAITIYLALRTRGFSGLNALAPAAIFLGLPSISLSPYYWFNSDVFGYPILATSVLAFVKKKYFLGSTLLSIAAIFKIHPILAIPLVIIWLVRKQGLSRTLPTIFATVSILSLGLIAPLLLPGYLGSILGFNLSSGFGAGTSSFTMMNLLYATVPPIPHMSVPLTVENQVWLAISASLFILALSVVWKKTRILTPVDIVAIGLAVWLLPLRQIYTHYLVWATVPFLMRGRLYQTLIVSSFLELANTMASWSWGLPPDPFPALASPAGFFATSLVYFSVTATLLLFSTRPTRILHEQKVRPPTVVVSVQKYPIPIIG